MQQQLVIVDVWYRTPDFPDVFQSMTWQTVDYAPDYERSRGFVQQLMETADVEHWEIRQHRLPVPKVDFGRVMPMPDLDQ